MKSLVSIYNYGNYSSSNYGSSRAVVVGDLTLYFSYQTVVAFEDNKTNQFVICENKWSSTTGRHLNWISRDKNIRVPYEEFQEKLEKTLLNYDL